MNKQVKIIEKSKLFLIISAVLMVAAIVLLIVPGINKGLDFTPGATLTVNLNVISSKDDGAYRDEIKSYIEDQGFTVEGTPQYVSREGNKLGIEFDLAYERNGVEYAESEDFSDELTGDEGLIESLREHLKTKYSNEEIIDELNYSMTSPDTTIKLTRNALLAIVLAIVAMLIYIAIRFKFTAGVAAVLVLVHDVMIMLLFTVIFRNWIPVNTTFIAAVITIVGYSINASIIVFDRIKENLAKYKDKGLTDAEIANKSIAETFRRTLLTTATTLIMIVLVAILGTDSIREFALPIIFGLVSSVYSATILASVLWVQIRKLSSKLLTGEKKGYQKYAKDKANKQA